MTFPIHIFAGYFFDLRFIPILLCFFYNGYRSLLIITVLHLSYRYYLGGNGFYTSAIVSCILILVLIFAGSFRASFSKTINLIKNGIEAMSEGGILQITADQRKNELIVDIIDQGIGMAQEEIDRLGMPFYSTKGKGTGLGTMFCYSFIKGLNGKIEVNSKKGVGTRFTVILPIQTLGKQPK